MRVYPHVAVDGVFNVHGIGHRHEPEHQQGRRGHRRRAQGQAGPRKGHDPGGGGQRRQAQEDQELLPGLEGESIVQGPHREESDPGRPCLPGQVRPGNDVEGPERQQGEAAAGHHGETARAGGRQGVDLPLTRCVNEL